MFSDCCDSVRCRGQLCSGTPELPPCGSLSKFEVMTVCKGNAVPAA